MGLVPAQGLGVVRRAVFFALLTWLPLVAWALYTGRILPGGVDEPLVVHFGVHVRFLLAVPALILGEAMAHRVSTRLIPYFLTSGVVPPAQRGAFVRVVGGVARLRDRTLPWVVIAVLVAAWTILQPVAIGSEAGHEARWASSGEAGGLGFGGWWFLYVSRPIFSVLLAAWLWRLALVFVLLKRIARLDLSIVPTHPDGAGGLGFLKDMPKAFSLLAFATSAVVASRLAHDVIYHDVTVQSLKVVLGLRRAGRRHLHRAAAGPRRSSRRRQASRPAGVRRPGRRARAPGAPALDPGRSTGGRRAPAGPGDRAGGRHPGPLRGGGQDEAVPFGKSTLLGIAVPTLIPILVLLSTQVPIKEVLKKIVGALL